MPIVINNSLPSINLHLGMVKDDKNHIRMIIDTGVAINTVKVFYCLWVISQYPQMGGNFLQWDMNTEYDTVQLLTTLDLDTTQHHVNHGTITVAIRYRISYVINKRGT